MKTKTTPSYKEGLTGLIDQLNQMMPTEVMSIFNADANQLEKTHTNPLKSKVGDRAPLFSLSNAIGETIHISDLLKTGPIVLTFYRGTWCPYCNLQLSLYQKTLSEIRLAGGNLVAISPQNPDQSLTIKEKNELDFEVLSDNGNVVARQYTSVFRNADAPVETMSELGMDFNSFYSDDSREIPVPAVFIIGQDGLIAYAKSEGGDYRNRIEPQEILEALKQVQI